MSPPTHRPVTTLAAAIALASAALGCGGLPGRRPSAAEARYERYLEEGHRLARRGKMVEAAAAFEDATYAMPDRAEGHYLLAKALVDTGQQYRALDELRLAERLRPGEAAQRVLLGRVLTELGRLDEARPVLTEAVLRWPDSAGAQLALGLLHLREDRLAEAELRLDRALRLAPRNASALEAAGRVLLRLGRTDEAVGRFQAAARASDCDDLAHGGLGAALVAQGRPAQGQASFEDAIGCAPQGSRAAWRAGLAMALAADGRFEPARRELEASGELVGGAVRRAIEERMRAAERGPRAAGCDAHETDCREANARLFSGALLLFVLGAPDAAERELRRSVDLYDGDPLARFALAEALAELGRREEAALELDRAAAWQPGEALVEAIGALRSRLAPGGTP